MKFYISTAWEGNYDKVLKKYPVLSKFKTKKESNQFREEAMMIEVDTLEELVELCDKVKEDIIIGRVENERQIIIYDDYIE